jgi:1,2-diacylglycerol 3-alpha-glucosyltransferase
MKIAIMTDSYYPTRDGVVTAVVTTKALLEAMGHQVVIIAPDPGEDRYREAGVFYFRAVKFKTYEGYFVPLFPSDQTELLRKIAPDVIHIHGIAFMAIKGLIASHNTGIPTILTFVTMVNEVVDQYSPIKMPKWMLERLVRIYLRKVLSYPNAIVVPTPSIGKELAEMGVKAKRLDIIPIGVDVNRFVNNGRGEEIRKRHSILGKKVIITVGRLSFEKNIDLTIRAMKFLDADTVLLICGKGPVGDDLKKITEVEGVSERVIFAGFVPDEELVSYYSAADIACSSSRFETQGLTILEAMSCGLPAICANGRAFTDFIEDGKNGYLFSSNEEDCARAIKQGFENAETLKVGARATAGIYSIVNTAKGLEKLYTEVINAKKAGCGDGHR